MIYQVYWSSLAYWAAGLYLKNSTRGWGQLGGGVQLQFDLHSEYITAKQFITHLQGWAQRSRLDFKYILTITVIDLSDLVENLTLCVTV